MLVYAAHVDGRKEYCFNMPTSSSNLKSKKREPPSLLANLKSVAKFSLHVSTQNYEAYSTGVVVTTGCSALWYSGGIKLSYLVGQVRFT